MTDQSKEAAAEETADQRIQPRAARIKLAQAQDYLDYLEMARRAKLRLDSNASSLEREIVDARNTVVRLAALADARIEQRRRLPSLARPAHGPRPHYLLFLDECGNHGLDPTKDRFPVFCLCCVIVASDSYPAFDALWKAWKTRWLGGPDILVHEPEVRQRSRTFYRADPAERQELITALDAQLAELDFVCISAVIDKRQFTGTYPSGEVDDFLPRSYYLMCLDFVMERAIHYLNQACGDAIGSIQAESRGPREDAEVQSEFLRLHLEGTQWQADQQFRQQLRPFIEFVRKSRNVSGLEIADLMARPIAAKVLNPTSTPERWPIVEAKIYDGGQGRKSSYGLKIFPSPQIEAVFQEVDEITNGAT